MRILMLDSNKGQMTHGRATVMGMVAACLPQGMRQVFFCFKRLQAAESPSVSVHFQEAISPSARAVQ